MDHNATPSERGGKTQRLPQDVEATAQSPDDSPSAQMKFSNELKGRLPQDLQDQLDLMSLHYWEECCALIYTACKPDDMTYTRSMLHRSAVVEHLQSFHNFTSDTQITALEKCLDRLLSLAQNPSELGEPIHNLPPRPFLPAPRKGWACSKCSFCTDDFRENKWHFENRHFSTLKWNEFPMQQVTVQRVDGTYFPVQMEDPVPLTRKQISSLETRLPNFLQYWVDCRAVVCVGCDEIPMLSRNDILPHVQMRHTLDEDEMQSIEKLLGDPTHLPGLADDHEKVRLPRPYLGEIPSISRATKGWSCSSVSCNYASESLDSVLQHESLDHPEMILPPKGKEQVLVQYVSLSSKQFGFPVARLDSPGPEIDQGHSQDSSDEPIAFVSNVEPNEMEFSFNSESSIKRGDPFRDTYTDEDRRQILATLWDNPSSSDLKPLSRKQVQQKLRQVSMRGKIEGVNEVRRFQNIYLQAILQTQHNIIELEERMSRGELVGVEKLNNMLIEYASLIKSYKEVSALKQAYTDGKSFAKLFATELHEPRYWYAPDATERIDLEESSRSSHDIVRKFLQQILPVVFLDSAGKAMRELDRIEDAQGKNNGGKFGKLSKVTESYRRHGRHISPSVDNFARILFAIFGGLFLLAPMVALAYITSKKWLVISTVLFVIVFAISLGLLSKGSNYELIAATAAYAAVLVVFVGNTIGPGPTIQPLEL